MVFPAGIHQFIGFTQMFPKFFALLAHSANRLAVLGVLRTVLTLRQTQAAR